MVQHSRKHVDETWHHSLGSIAVVIFWTSRQASDARPSWSAIKSTDAPIVCPDPLLKLTKHYQGRSLGHESAQERCAAIRSDAEGCSRYDSKLLLQSEL
mmetsp:Transcript_4946/g.10740  ORF Transcript_4946/g.10740 Transcript_4946/m.10740 type:complete len:99 (-) Transcript_4946:1175-1471(-)|eukprot:6186851-Pleurochrysis_carterae.AAC.8